jgi:nicotinamidase-related amidase/type 1 glutamine amidotransferase
MVSLTLMKTRLPLRLFLLLAFALPLACRAAGVTEPLAVTARTRVWSGPGTNDWGSVDAPRTLDPRRTAVVICDMWDKHWCAGATRRVAEMAPRMNDLVTNARQRGMLIIHCPSDTMKFYEGASGRKLAQAAPPAEPKVPLQRWCKLDPAREAPLPIDDADGGCDDSPPCKTHSAWKQEIPAIEIRDGDAITDSAEAYYLMRQRGITNVLVMGVHLNMCVLGRPFSIRQMVSQGQNVLLVRDMTDTMYNSRQRPWIPHCAGTQLMIEHVEKYWCPTIASTALVGGEEFRFKEDRRSHVVFLIGEDEYKTWVTLPQFAREELAWRGLRVSVVVQSEGDIHRFPGLVDAMRDADLLVVSVRRRALPKDQLNAVRAHLEAGKPLLGIRTASHAFAPRPDDADKGAAWTTFDPDVLGGNYTGHHGNGPKTTIATAAGAEGNALLAGVDISQLTGNGSLYKVSPLKTSATPLLVGTIPGQPAEPVSWMHTFGEKQARVFYTSLGHPDDFANAAFRRLLLNAVLTLVDRPLPPAGK